MNDDNAKKLIDAIEVNDTATASSLISSGSMNLNGYPWPLHRAAQIGSVEIMTMLLDAGADFNAVDKDRYTACHVAIWSDELMRSNCFLSGVQISASSIQEATHCSRLSCNIEEKSYL
jgi:ankyrin repeat protein